MPMRVTPESHIMYKIFVQKQCAFKLQLGLFVFKSKFYVQHKPTKHTRNPTK
jgi:hypothetical protein